MMGRGSGRVVVARYALGFAPKESKVRDNKAEQKEDGQGGVCSVVSVSQRFGSDSCRVNQLKALGQGFAGAKNSDLLRRGAGARVLTYGIRDITEWIRFIGGETSEIYALRFCLQHLQHSHSGHGYLYRYGYTAGWERSKYFRAESLADS
jgi:hypothetical protein